MRELAARLGLGDRVVFHGWLPEARVAAMLRAVRALVFPSCWHEPSGTVMLAAAAAGRAVIASRVGGIPEYVEHEQTGLLVPVNDVAALAAALVRLTVNADQAAALGAAGRQTAVERFSMAAHLEGLADLYREAAGA